MKRKRNRGAKVPRRFVTIDCDLLNSPAYKKLTGETCKAFPIFIWKGRHPKNVSEGCFSFPYKEAVERYGITRPTFYRAIGQLHEVGIIDVVGYGGLRGCRKTDAKYRLSERWRLYGKPEFEFRPRYDLTKLAV